MDITSLIEHLERFEKLLEPDNNNYDVKIFIHNEEKLAIRVSTI
ncbi:9148_t:CDS:2 [Entrophospora sp. SA101]|nr:9148_t:CDS:2 [Entrophospora sp. SA101]